MKFSLLINVKIPTIVGILTFISRIYTAFESFNARNIFFLHFSFMSSGNIYHAQLSIIFILQPWGLNKVFVVCSLDSHGFKPSSSCTHLGLYSDIAALSHLVAVLSSTGIYIC